MLEVHRTYVRTIIMNVFFDMYSRSIADKVLRSTTSSRPYDPFHEAPAAQACVVHPYYFAILSAVITAAPIPLPSSALVSFI